MLPSTSPFQERVREWVATTFGETIANDKRERCDRFVEESLELVQAIGYDRAHAHMLVDYVFDRPAGEPEQELGGVQVTMNALASAIQLDAVYSGDKELARCWTKADEIREKQKSKPRNSPLPA